MNGSETLTFGEAQGLAGEAAPPPAKDPLKVDLAEIKFPPADKVDELDNAAASAAASEAPEIAVLDFVGEELPYRDVTHRYPFRRADGEVRRVTRVRQLTTAEIGEIYAEWGRSSRAPDYYDLYARMTALTAPELRGLPAVDGDPITAAAYDFLSPLFRVAVASASTPATG